MPESEISEPTRGCPMIVECDGARLAGQRWPPRGELRAAVLMWPGSGPSDRHNDVYFPPIRQCLVDLGCGVASFDKRGVGESTGSWLTSGIDEQARDARACLGELRRQMPGVPIGIFGHSQGGWVAIEAARDADFVIVNSGPGVSPAAQERYATSRRLAERARDRREFADASRCFELALTCMSNGVAFEDVAGIVERAGLQRVYAQPDLFSFPIDNAEVWELATLIIEHDPRPALRSLHVPTLALFGAEDPIVPVDASVVAYESNVRPDLLTVALVPDGDHRIQRGDTLVDGYVPTLRAFVERVLD